MIHDPPNPLSARRTWLFVAIVAAGLVAALKLDALVEPVLADPQAHLHDWHRMLRVMGYVPLWLIASVIFALHDWPRTVGLPLLRRLRRGLILTVATLGAGAGAEVLKLVVRRERPEFSEGAGEYAFRSIFEGLISNRGLGFPSSHAAVAFAAAFALGAMLPRTRLVWLLLATGCGYTRLADGAHHLSDVYFGAVVGYMGAWVALRVLRHRPHPPQSEVQR